MIQKIKKNELIFFFFIKVKDVSFISNSKFHIDVIISSRNEGNHSRQPLKVIRTKKNKFQPA
ncbi:hypothetical protein DDB_G0278323 [Dictyostelium discoideum AX4]|uniref:Uncharacterized protein n=1 Tax=Dictyostelium discoideum TaxID=44689 RepID=Q54YB1_DICDI|nr:hypothetical protein DDB_G0278323 [Dictyostelium discoideum AX4]EAL68334.1 hypothetical protein DDB_G0278323 [Dictyostelium discoideum AX4]|eukprot:XP_642291.1 hypothetical protein DDB_G0278323 [Dictyostelium discoideum AX4]